ncbi:MAG: transglycosylase SLT domain-containing protein [Bacteroidota bacterium]
MKSGRYLTVWALSLFAWGWPIIGPSPQAVDPELQIEEFQIQLAANCYQVIQDSSLYTQGWDKLVQPLFWREAMQLPPDTVLVNVAKTRQIVEILNLYEYRARGERKQKAYEDSLRTVYGLGKKDEIFFTTGRNHFYRFQEMLGPIDKAIPVFIKEQTDPWYAQAILLIESPGRLQYSTDGAYGAFQLMKGVAKDMGLTVNEQVDEREDFEKAAAAAARLLRTTCIPKARKLCEDWKLSYKETDLWFRLLTMHIYHAGIGNVKRVVKRIKPKEGGQALITKMWQTKGRRFGNASQNYSQIILACFMELDALLQTEGIICPDLDAKPKDPDTSPVPLDAV